MEQFADYQPGQHVLDGLKNVRMAVVVGPTAAGKTTLLEAAKTNPELHFVITTVSRAPRPGEIDGEHYHFRSKAEMQAAIKRREYVNIATSPMGDLYATDLKSFPQDGVAMMAVWAHAVPYFCSLPFKEVHTIFVVPPNFETWQKRLGNHGFKAAQLQKRLSEAKCSLEFGLYDRRATCIVNDNLQEAVNDFMRAVLRQSLQIGQSKAREHIVELLKKLTSLS
jgi:guanylate kinase